METQVKAYVVVAVIGLTVFYFLQRPFSAIVKPEHFKSWRNTWLAVTTILFLTPTPSFWLFSAVIALYLLISAPRNIAKRLPLYFAILCAVPLISETIPGFAGIESLFEVQYARILALTFLLPLWIKLVRNGHPRGKLLGLSADKYVLLLCVVVIVLYVRDPDANVTSMLRRSFVVFLDIFLPYYVISRYARDLHSLNSIMVAILISVSIMAFVGIFEFLHYWRLFEIDHGVSYQGSGYRIRGSYLRTQASFGHPITFGYVLVIAFGSLLAVGRKIQPAFYALAIGGLLAAAEITPLSRGPWIGFGVLIAVWLATGKHRIMALSTAGVALLTVVPLLGLTAFGESLYRMLPFVGDVAQSDFRSRLFDVSLDVAAQNLWFGSPRFLETPEMQALAGRWGVIDITNTYLQYLLETGIVGLGIFVSVFVTLAYRILRIITQRPPQVEALIPLGRALFAMIVATAVVIVTVSSITFVPVYYWALAGVSAAYLAVVKEYRGDAGDRNLERKTADEQDITPLYATKAVENDSLPGNLTNGLKKG